MMYSRQFFSQYPMVFYPNSPFVYNEYNQDYSNPSSSSTRQQAVYGQATWTDGGPVTKCGIPWSDSNYMTASVGVDSPYRCGQTIKIRNPSSPSPKEIIVKIVDQVSNYPVNKINLHRNAFQALGSNPSVGVISVEMILVSPNEQDEWGRYVINIIQAAYPNYNIRNYLLVEKTELSPGQIKQMYQYTLQTAEGTRILQGSILYDTSTNRVISIHIDET